MTIGRIIPAVSYERQRDGSLKLTGCISQHRAPRRMSLEEREDCVPLDQRQAYWRSIWAGERG